MDGYGFLRIKHGARGSVVPKVPYQRISLTLSLVQPEKQKTEAP